MSEQPAEFNLTSPAAQTREGQERIVKAHDKLSDATARCAGALRELHQEFRANPLLVKALRDAMELPVDADELLAECDAALSAWTTTSHELVEAFRVRAASSMPTPIITANGDGNHD
jgi:hypothetical protein